MSIRNFLANLLSAKQASASVPQSQEERDAARLAEARAWIAAREAPTEVRDMKPVAPMEYTAPGDVLSDPEFFYVPGNVFNLDRE